MATCDQTVTVTDNQHPTITCAAPINTFANATCVATGVALGTPTTADNCSVASVTNNAPVSFPLGATTVTWTVIDGSGNSATCDQIVTVTDNQDPTITCAAPVAVFANAGSCSATSVALGNPITADNCSVASVTNDAPATFPLGVTTVTWTVTDGSANTATCTQTVTVSDNQNPTISCAAPVNAFANATCEATGVALGTPTTADNCSVASVTNNAPATFPLGATTVTWTVTDGSGNMATCDQTVTVTDNQNPVISDCPSNFTVNNDLNNCGAIVNWAVPTFTDNCGATMVSSNNSGQYFSVGTHTVTYTVSDNAENVSICSFDLTVIDAQVPTISCPAPIESCDPVISYNLPVISDNCGIQSFVQTAGLPSGIFPVGTTTNVFMATDIHGNNSTCSFTVTIHPIPSINLAVTNVSCYAANNGSIDATITVGSAPYSYTWSNSANTEDVSNLSPGVYVLDIVDDNGCVNSEEASITEPEELSSGFESSQVNCFNGTDGSIDLFIEGGTVPYTYDWNNGSTDEDLNGIGAGTYEVTISDANGCSLDQQISITEPDSLNVFHTSYDATCNSATGSISVSVSGGTNPYSFSWSDGSTDINLINVVAGIYDLTVTDANGCVNTITDTIGTTSSLTAELSPRDVLCYGDSSGQIAINILTGYAPYTYEWNDGQSGSTATGLSAGNYSVVITDIFGCQITLNAAINQPDSLYIVLSNSVYSGGYNISQYGGSDGYINSTVYGGTSPYEYAWFGPQEFTSDDANISNLGQGAYLLTVVDANGCAANASTRLTQPAILEMPNGISPNGDKDNEFFVVHGIDAYPDNTIQIFNRWGNLVYELYGYNNEWNGENMNGEPLPDGTYFVVLVVRVNGEELEPLTGYVDLRR